MATSCTKKTRPGPTARWAKETGAFRSPQLLVGVILWVALACAVALILGGTLVSCSSPSSPGATNVGPFSQLVQSDIPEAGIQIIAAATGPPEAGSGELYLKVRGAEGQGASVYQATAEKLLSITDNYQQELHLDRLHVIIVAAGGAVLYDHTLEVTSPSSTTSTT